MYDYKRRGNQGFAFLHIFTIENPTNPERFRLSFLLRSTISKLYCQGLRLLQFPSGKENIRFIKYFTADENDSIFIRCSEVLSLYN